VGHRGGLHPLVEQRPRARVPQPRDRLDPQRLRSRSPGDDNGVLLGPRADGHLPADRPARRTVHQRFNELEDPEPVPLGKECASLIESGVSVVVQHTRLDSRQAENALLSTAAFAGDA
jgi:Anabaena sensory rhodopsin transducer